MAVSVVPELIDALVDVAADVLPDVIAHDGPKDDLDSGDYLLIGVPDIDPSSNGAGVTVTQEWANVSGTARDEEGDITCAALSWNGDGDMKAARDAVYSYAEALAAHLREHYSLGLTNLLWTGFGDSLSYLPYQDENGAEAALIFTIHFRARI